MNVRPLAVVTVLAATALLGACATTEQQPAATGPASEVQVYSTTQLVPNQYTIVDHIWTDELKSNVSIPTFSTAEEGVNAMKQKAAAVGATGLLNVMCLDAAGYAAKGQLLCYGDAIKFNN